MAASKLVEDFERMEASLPASLDLPPDLTEQQFGTLLKTLKKLHKRTAIYWGQVYKEAINRFGQDAYQHFDFWDYSERTLQNYARVVDRLDPNLWNSDLPDRHLMAISQNTQDHEEQARWVEYAKTNQVSGDDLRDEIHRDHEERGIRTKAEKAVWHNCETCSGRGGWIEEKEENRG